ncbi:MULTISPECIES: Flp family type IVb pilin [unclassified Sulfitobacter]|uniref:Flp family type IVb pilin n=1 Tax=unclassified Sulfitobacter TaxID=196795 RepID=UPI0023E267E0|nr:MULTISPECIES: hypothetical protein [unclassified Sulfitobacter]MDF3385848.1 hypothetical protein [Sulfitobacter sp. M85]MDF3382429.1 hypothetical protein [Sulfitobacter sp. Ks11]MDF3389267.1 hypothetical protein [Sulfitobacter sp. Ks16]MDF3399904.1 hypothetical protein [Sulfitobacter sp. KE39]MDF3403325.1 hypothetical protein [Sulfitobacter sp. Ks35]
MYNFLKSFSNDQSGAISVEWVALTGGLVGLAILVLGLFSDSIDVLLEYIRVKLST